MHSLLEAKFGNFPLKLQGKDTKKFCSCLVRSQLLVKTKEYTRVFHYKCFGPQVDWLQRRLLLSKDKYFIWGFHFLLPAKGSTFTISHICTYTTVSISTETEQGKSATDISSLLIFVT